MDVYLNIFLFMILLPQSLSDDACKFVNDDYCFRFGQMPCYQKICECEQKNCTDMSDCVLSPWCDPSGKFILTNELVLGGELLALLKHTPMAAPSQLPRIRSIIRFTLPKFFDPETYIWNRFSSADAILVDIRKRDDVDNSEWRRERLYQALDKAPYKPRIYVEATSRREHPDIWLKDISTCAHPRLHGFLMNLKDGDVLREVEKIAQRGKLVEDCYRKLTKVVSPIFKDASMIVDIETKSIPYVIFKYHNFGARREGGWNHLNDLANKAQAANVMALGWRSRPIRRHAELEREMITLKELGFAGVLLHDSDQIELANKTFSPVDQDCNSLRKNCLTREKNNGYCYIYRQNCAKNEDVEDKLERNPNEKLVKDCRRWKRICEQKYPKHYACKQFKRKCISLNITVVTDNKDETTSSEENRTDRRHKQKAAKMCSKWERKCAEKWPNHYSCRMLKSKCSSQNPVIQPITGLKADNSTNSAEEVEIKDRKKILEQCQKWKKTCARKYPRHFSCRQYRRRCKFVDLQSGSSSNSSVAASRASPSALSTLANSTIVDGHRDQTEDSDETTDLLDIDS